MFESNQPGQSEWSLIKKNLDQIKIQLIRRQ